jgi:DNA-binding transcriptional regulator WhiA
MPQFDTSRRLNKKQAQWKKEWIGVFLAAGIDRDEANYAFEVYYGNQEVCIFQHPIVEAQHLTGIAVLRH